MAVKNKMFLDVICFPLMSKIYITAPKNTFIICPTDKIISVSVANLLLNSLPKMERRKFGNKMIIRNIGKLNKKVNFAADCTVLARDCIFLL